MHRMDEMSMHAKGQKLTCERCLADGNDLGRQAAVATRGDLQLPAHGDTVFTGARCMV